MTSSTTAGLELQALVGGYGSPDSEDSQGCEVLHEADSADLLPSQPARPKAIDLTAVDSPIPSDQDNVGAVAVNTQS